MELRSGPLHADPRVHPHVSVAPRAGAAGFGGGAAARALAAAAILAGAGAPAAAQVALEVSPLRVEMAASGGSTATQAVALTNAGSVPLRVRAHLSDWHLARDGSPQFEHPGAPDAPFSATGWVRLAPPEQVIEPGRDAVVRFSLAVPADAEAAGYRTAILFEFAQDSPAAARGSAVSVRSRIATLLYVNVGQPPASVDLVDLRHRLGNGRTHMVAVLKNTGRRTVRTKGSLALFTHTGAEARRVPVPDVPVLPESEREIAIAIADDELGPLSDGEYRVELKIDAGMPALLVGESTLRVGR